MSLKTSLIIDLAGNLQSRSRQYGQSLTSMGKAGQAAMRGIRSAAVQAGQGLNALGNRYTAVITGAGAGMAVRNVMQTEQLFTRLRIAMGASEERMKAVKHGLEDVANMKDIRVPFEEMVRGYKAIIDSTGDDAFAEANRRNLGLLMSATGADAESAGGLLVQFRKMGVTSAEEVAQAIAILSEQAKAGAFPLEHLATNGAKYFSMLAAHGRQGLDAVREGGAALQTAFQTTEGSDTAVSSAMSFMNDIVAKADILKKRAKINVFEMIDGKKVTRSPVAIMKDILEASKGDIELIKEVLGDDGLKAIMAAMGQFNATGQTGDLDSFKAVAGDVKILTDDAATAAQTANAALQSLKNTWDSFADSQLAEPIQQAADALNRMGPEKMMETLNTAKNVALVLGGVVLASKAIGVAANVRSVFGKKNGAAGTDGAGGALGMGGLGGIKLPLPVYVVNKHMSLTRDALTGGAGRTSGGAGGTPPPRGGRASRTTRIMGRVGGAAEAGLAVYEAGRAVMDGEATLADKATDVAGAGAEALGGWAGAAMGAKAGAVLGSFIPGFGTAIGAALGAAVGGIGGAYAGSLGMDKAMDWVKGMWEGEQAAAQMQPLADQMRAMQDNVKGALYDSTIRIQVDGAATASVTSNNGMGNLDVYSGTSFAAGLSD